MTAFADDAAAAAAAAAKPRARQTRTIIWVVLALAAGGIVYLAWSRMQARTPEAVSVRVLSPRPAAVYRWFSGQGTVTDYETRALSFPSPGTLAELLPSGSTFAAGELLGKLHGAAPLEGLLSRARARVSFYQQMRESMRVAGNHIELRQAEIKLAEKQRLVDEAAAALAKLTVRASEPGEVVETMAKVGGYVRAGAPLVRVKGRVLHGEFALDQDDAAIARDLAFCRVEVVGLGPRASNAEARGASDTAADTGSPDAQAGPRFIDCTLAKDGGGRDKLRVVLPANVGLVPGQPLRLARQRFDAVFPIPPALVSDAGSGQKSVWVAGRAGVAERRDVTLAESGDEALVASGLQVGDEVIVDAPADLREGAAIAVRR
jgi:multidrug efflux pump subunit AcrA (membrane-fusion protein)